jgi:hypothetical protein
LFKLQNIQIYKNIILGKEHTTPIVWGTQIIVQIAVPTNKKEGKTAAGKVQWLQIKPNWFTSSR